MQTWTSERDRATNRGFGCLGCPLPVGGRGKLEESELVFAFKAKRYRSTKRGPQFRAPIHFAVALVPIVENTTKPRGMPSQTIVEAGSPISAEDCRSLQTETM
jgi:hypothetical protein